MGFCDTIDDMLAAEHVRERMRIYARGVDRRDVELLRSVFWPDAIIEHGGETFDGATWPDAIVSGWSQRSLHLIGNHSVEVDGEQAHSEVYCNSFLHMEPDDRGPYMVNRALRYIDLFQRRGSEWKVVRRKVTREWDRIIRFDEMPRSIPYLEGQRSTEDYSYWRPLTRDDPQQWELSTPEMFREGRQRR